MLARRREPGEADLAAVAAPDGTSVFFCARASGGWLADFLALEPERRRGAPVPIDRIDHVALAQPFDAFDEAALFYRSVLGLQPRDSQELAGPDGLVRSRAVAERRRARAARAQRPAAGGAEHGQAELQHVAFACDDALAAARAMRERGAPLLRDPGQLLRRPRGAARARPGRCSTRCASSASSTTAPRRGELLHFYTARVGRPRVLRGGRAARRLRRLRRRQLAGPDGGAADDRRAGSPDEEESMQTSEVAEREAPRRRRAASARGGRGARPPRAPPLRRLIGPSVILIGVGIASGEYILYPFIASQAGLVFLWAAVVGILVQFFINMEIERYTLATGETAIGGFQRLWKPLGAILGDRRDARHDVARVGDDRGDGDDVPVRRRRREHDRDRRPAGRSAWR